MKNILSDSRIFWEEAQKFIHHYLSNIRKASGHTVSSYRDGLNGYISYLEIEMKMRRKNICFDDLSKEKVLKYQDWLLNTRKNAPKTSNLRLTALRSFLEYAAGEHTELTALYLGLCEIKDTKVPVNSIEFFEKEQMKAILAATDIRTKTGRRNRMIMILLYDSAARISELLGLELADIHLDAEIPYATLHGKGDKYRNVPLMEKTCRHLKGYIQEFHAGSDENAPLFYATAHGRRHHLSHDTAENLIKKCSEKAKQAGVKMPKSCHCHMVRKTRAMDLYQSGVPLAHIQQLLGHEDVSTTTGFYAFATLDTLARSMEKSEGIPGNAEKNWKNPDTLKRLYSL